MLAIQHDFAYDSYCVSASGSDTWPRLVHDRKEHDSGFQGIWVDGKVLSYPIL